MHPRLTFIADRLAADFPVLPEHGLTRIRVVDDSHFGISVAYGPHVYGSIDTADPEQRIALAAGYFQDVVVDNLMRTWPEADGRPLFASAASGVACWTLDGTPYCAIGHLAAALAAQPHPIVG